MRLVLPALAALCLAAPLAAPLAAQGDSSTPEQIAAAALEAAPVWDGHNDVPWALRGRYNNLLAAFNFRDTQAVGEGPLETAMHTDLARLRRGRVGAQFWSVYVPSTVQPEAAAVQAAIEQIDVAHRLFARYPDDLQLALTADDVERAMAAGKIASLIGMEGGHAIGSSLAVVRQMYALGARYMTLTHSANTPWADSATDIPAHEGLTDFGRDVVREMQRIGMLVDLSHVSEATMLDALDVAEQSGGGAPLIFSHSGARAVDGHPRNVPDGVLARLKGNGGIVMMVAYPAFVSEGLRRQLATRAGEEARLKALFPGQPDQVATQLDAWDAANPEVLATVSDVADHIDHIRQVAGIDHIGLGADYDGMDTGPVGMEDVSGYPALFVELARRGYSQEDLEKIASRNMMRVLRAAEAFAAAHASDPPIETPVAE